jgi:hypothetical protein
MRRVKNMVFVRRGNEKQLKGKKKRRGEDGVPKGIRTPVTAVKGRGPRPLDDGDKTV